jgi:hypothetical protein
MSRSEQLVEMCREARGRLVKTSRVENAGASNVCPIHGKHDVFVVRLSDASKHYQCQECTLLLDAASCREEAWPALPVIPERFL